MGLYIDGKRLSELTTETGWAGSDILTGLKSGDNKNITITELTTMVIDNVETVDPLPPGTYAKVMYKGVTSWGASTSFVTDGNIVGIGLSAPNGGHQLEIKYNGTAQNLLNAYKKDLSDAQVKGLSYSSTGIFFVVDTGIPANIDSNSNANTYSSYFEKGVIGNEHIFMNNGNTSALRFGTFHGTTGVFTESGKVDMASDAVQIRALEFVMQSSANEYIRTGLRGASNDTPTVILASRGFVCKDITNDCSKIFLGTPGTSIPIQSAIGAEAMIRATAIGSSPIAAFINSTGSEILKMTFDGKVYWSLPTYASAGSGEMCLDGEVVKIKA